jgi:CrcB protein
VVDSAIVRRWPHEIAIGTTVINVMGSFIAGVVVGGALAHGLSPTLRTIVVTGFCGGLTTWSTAMFETVRLIMSRRLLLAIGFGIGGLAVSVAAAIGGIFLVGA